MQPYRNLSGDSGVTEYEIGADYVLVRFRTGRPYRYSYSRAGQIHVEQMKLLATAGQGLSKYIGRHVHKLADPQE